MTHEWKPKEYKFNNKTLKWGENISKENLNLMDEGEIFILIDKNGKQYSTVKKDSYGQIREKLINWGG